MTKSLDLLSLQNVVIRAGLLMVKANCRVLNAYPLFGDLCTHLAKEEILKLGWQPVDVITRRRLRLESANKQ